MDNICIFFTPFSGGKFIANCLALSRHIVCNDFYLACQDIKHKQFDQHYYNFKLQSILSSLSTDFAVSRQWKEFGELNNKNITLVNSHNKRVCVIAHTIEQQQTMSKYYSGIPTLRLINFKKFNSQAFLLKHNKPELLQSHQSGFDWWQDSTPPGDIELDIDLIMYKPETFLPNMKRLYDFFKLEDFDQDRLHIFYKAYRNLHNL